MNRKSLVLILVGAICCIGLLFAHDANRKSEKIASIKTMEIYPNPKFERFKVPTIQMDEPIAVKKSSEANKTARTEVIFNDDFEGGKGAWQAGASWGIRATSAGYLDEKTSDWVPSKTNSHSATTSWRETGVTPSSTDLLMSPAFTLPTTVDGGAPLARLSLDFWIDWDAANAANRVYIHLGKDEALWDFDAVDPGAGTSSWSVHNPGTPPYDVFSRQYLTTPEIDLTGVAAPISLSFLYKSISEPEFDFNKVDVFTKDDNYVSYTTVASFEGPDGSAGGGTATWKTHTVNLDAYAGKVVKIRFGEFGDFGFVQAGSIFALDNIAVTGPSGNIFTDDGGESGSSTMTAEGFAAGSAVVAFAGVPNPNPTWVNVAVPGNLLATGADGTLSPGDDVRIAVVFAYDPGGSGAAHTVGRGLFVDDFNLVGQTIQDDVAAVNVVVPFPAKVGDALNFSLNVKNTGINPQSNVQWQGSILDANTGAQVASVVGRRTDPIAPGATVAIPAITNWTPAAAGVYRVRAFTRLTNDEDRSNDTTLVANDDANGFGDARYSPFVVHAGNVLFSSALYNAPASPTPAQLLTRGFVVKSAPAPGVVTWQTTNNAFVPAVNGVAGHGGAYIQFDSLGRSQDEELIIPNLNFSTVTSNAWLAFKGLGVGGFGYTRFSIGVSNDGGRSWIDVFERRRGIDPQTGQNFGGPAFFTAAMRPGLIDITRWAAGQPNVQIRFRYEGENDADWTLWSIAVSGRGIQAANLVSVVDIAPDQGKQVRVTWDRSANDGSIAGVPITQYGVWRREKPAGPFGSVKPEADAIIVADRQALLADISNLKPGTRFYETSTANHWDFVGGVIARSEARYGFVSPTLVDSLVYEFMISAHTANPLVFGNSNIVQGFSVDNLAPDAPALSGGAQSGFVQLNWTEPTVEEPKFYSIYRRLASEPSFGAAIAKIGAREYQDTNIQRNTSYVYAVTATDYGSNESARSNELPVTSTAVAGQTVEIPTDYALAQNHPNPFNPTTMIQYQVPKAGEVKLTIINSLGQKVRTLVAGQVAAGYHQIMWDARDDNGKLVGSGTYLYRIEAGNFVQTKKLVLMK